MRETEPADKVAELLEHGQPDAYLVSSSDPIGSDADAYAQQQPPHVQAKNTYVKYLERVGGRRFLVTMEEPSEMRPQPIVFEISPSGCKLTPAITGSATIISSPAPRAG
jgi:hypothetical protein